MIKYILLAVAAWVLSGAIAHAGETPSMQIRVQATPAPTWNDFVKESIDANHAPNVEMTANRDPAPSDLTVAPEFGMWTLFSPSLPGTLPVDIGLRVFLDTECRGPAQGDCDPTETGFYVVGRKRNTNNTWLATIARRQLDGSYDSGFGDGGWIYPSTDNSEVVDAAMADDRMYVLSTTNVSGTPVMFVTCTVLSTGDPCLPYPGSIVDFGAGATHPIRSAWARRIVYDSRYGLFVAGRVWTTARGWEIAIARLDADTGELITEFRGDGTNVGLPGWAAQTNSDIDVFDMAVAPAGTPGGERLYIAGTVKLDATDYDGFVLGLNPYNGYTSTGWLWPNFYYEADNAGYKKDAITAITVQRNGRLAMAGWTETDTPNEHLMILARTLTNGTFDPSFCAGEPVCKSSVRRLKNGPDDDLPAAMVERAGNRDLVVVLKQNSGDADAHPVQTIYQFGSSGTVVHAGQYLDYPSAPGMSRWSQPFGMCAFKSTETGEDFIGIVGTRAYTRTTNDSTMSLLVATDSIFADSFGGPHND